MWPFRTDVAEYKRRQEEKYKEGIAAGLVRIDDDGSAWDIYPRWSEQQIRAMIREEIEKAMK